MEHITQSPPQDAVISPEALQDKNTVKGTQVAGNTAGKLDFSRLQPPADLGENSMEEITIDGICGVY